MTINYLVKSSPLSPWAHPLLHASLNTEQLYGLSYYYLVKLLPFFKNCVEGSIGPGVNIDFSSRMKNRLGSADLRHRLIILNKNYFKDNTSLLPYTLFHELTHIWLYDCDLDPGHTSRFYNKMYEFNQTGLPLDEQVHIHKRRAPEGEYVYICPHCEFKWYQSFRTKHKTYCGYCEKNHKKRIYISLLRTP